MSSPSDRLFMARTQVEVMQSLRRALAEPGCLVALTGEEGVGKTSVLNAVLAEMAGTDTVVTKASEPREAQRAAAALLEAASEGDDPGRSVLVLENAHTLPQSALRDLAAAIDAAEGQPLPSTVVFVGRPEFWLRLSGPALASLREAITVRTVLFPMPYPDAEAYVDHLLTRAGSSARAALAPGVLHGALVQAQGNFRRINASLEAALATDVARRRQSPPRRPRLGVAGSMPMDRARVPWQKPPQGGLGRIAAVCALGVAVLAVLSLDDSRAKLGGSAPVATSPTLRPEVPPAPVAPRPAEQAAASPASGPATAPTVPAPRPATDVPSAKAAPDGIAALLVQSGDAMLAAGDVLAAQLLYERAFAVGSAAAAVAMARIYDPEHATPGAQTVVRRDAALAAAWYRRAAALGQPRAIGGPTVPSDAELAGPPP